MDRCECGLYAAREAAVRVPSLLPPAYQHLARPCLCLTITRREAEWQSALPEEDTGNFALMSVGTHEFLFMAAYFLRLNKLLRLRTEVIMLFILF
jgi:hypothetical protein